jgi:hypothetical protein
MGPRVVSGSTVHRIEGVGGAIISAFGTFLRRLSARTRSTC